MISSIIDLHDLCKTDAYNLPETHTVCMTAACDHCILTSPDIPAGSFPVDDFPVGTSTMLLFSTCSITSDGHEALVLVAHHPLLEKPRVI